MKTIKLGDPMPEPCKKCGGLYGYVVFDNVRCTYGIEYNADGSYWGGSYGDTMKNTKEGKRAYCSSCGNDLKLKVIRD